MGSLLSISIYITESGSIEKNKFQYYTNYQSYNSWREKLIPADCATLAESDRKGLTTKYSLY